MVILLGRGLRRFASWESTKALLQRAAPSIAHVDGAAAAAMPRHVSLEGVMFKNTGWVGVDEGLVAGAEEVGDALSTTQAP